MNEFDEHTWTAAQRALDGAIAADVEALGGSRYLSELAGGNPAEWAKSMRGSADEIRARCAKLTHAGRRAHWDRQLAALGLVAAVKPEPARTTSTGPATPPDSGAAASPIGPRGGKAKDG